MAYILFNRVLFNKIILKVDLSARILKINDILGDFQHFSKTTDLKNSWKMP